MPLDVLDLDQCTLCANISYAEQPHARNSLSRAMLLKATMVFNLVAFLVALIQPASAFHIKRLRTDSGTVLRLRGDVRAGDFARLNSILQNEAIIGLEIRSGGGSLEDGVEIARVVRDKGLVVYVSKECDSVCAFIFFAAKERYIGRGCKIGVHSVSNQHGKEDAETAQSTVKMSRLLTGFGVPHSVIGKIVATPPANITFLSNRELAGLNVRRSNPFRNPSAGLARSQEATSACDPRTNFETEVFPRRTKVLCALRRVYLRQSGDN
jgi:hypothetical protein